MSQALFGNERIPTVLTDPQEVAGYMREHLGIDLATTSRALQAGVADSAMTTAHSPASAAGSRLWEGVIRQLRDDLVLKGWTMEQPGQLEVVRRGDGRVQITASLGDSGTGDPTCTPSPEHPRGGATQVAVEANELTFADVDPDEPAWRSIETWWLLYRSSPTGPNRLYAELSLPVGMAGKRINAWATRLILPEFEFDPGMSTLVPEPAAPPQVVFSRRAG